MIDCTVDGDVLDIRTPSVRKARLLAGIALLIVGPGLPVFGLLTNTGSWLIISLPAGVIIALAGLLLVCIRQHTRIDRKQALAGIVIANSEHLRRARPLPSTGHVTMHLVYSGFEVAVCDPNNAPVAPIITLADYGEARQAAESICALLRMSLHDECRGDTVVYRARDSRPPLKQILGQSNGKLPDAPEVNRVEVQREGRKMRIGIPPRITALHLALFAPAAVLWTLALGFGVNGQAVVASSCIVLWALVFSVSLVLHPGLLGVTTQQLAFTHIEIQDGTLSVKREWPNKNSETRELKICDLRELFYLPSPEWGVRPGIVLVTGSEVLSIADHLTEPEAAYVCDLMRIGILAA
jgi:hypothetical protein